MGGQNRGLIWFGSGFGGVFLAGALIIGSFFDGDESASIWDVASKLNPYKGCVKTHKFVKKWSVCDLKSNKAPKWVVLGSGQGGPGQGQGGLAGGCHKTAYI